MLTKNATDSQIGKNNFHKKTSNACLYLRKFKQPRTTLICESVAIYNVQYFIPAN